ncbi:hypothetical protein QUF90_13400 [Desulfococcaceae bacterium HSG9]|nr:hypothetical protein [Desulfococcaceae bacterium HSG9]
MSASEYAVPTGLSGHGGFGFYKYAAPTELKTDMLFIAFQKLFDLLNVYSKGWKNESAFSRTKHLGWRKRAERTF